MTQTKEEQEIRRLKDERKIERLKQSVANLARLGERNRELMREAAAKDLEIRELRSDMALAISVLANTRARLDFHELSHAEIDVVLKKLGGAPWPGS